jgi:hypothetical protein
MAAHGPKSVSPNHEQGELRPRLRRLLPSPGQADLSPVPPRLWHEHPAWGRKRPLSAGTVHPGDGRW